MNDADALDRLHDLRCSFGAHPAASNWWDFAEIYGDAVDLLFDSAQRVIGSISDLERLHRSVDPDPTSWSCWFEENSEMLLEAVWFTRVP